MGVLARDPEVYADLYEDYVRLLVIIKLEFNKVGNEYISRTQT